MVNEKEVLQDRAQRLRAAFPGEVKDVVLLGSQNTGKTTEDADYDLLLVRKGEWVSRQKKWAVNSVCFERDLQSGILTHTILISEEELIGLRDLQPIFKDALEFGAYAA